MKLMVTLMSWSKLDWGLKEYEMKSRIEELIEVAIERVKLMVEDTIKPNSSLSS